MNINKKYIENGVPIFIFVVLLSLVLFTDVFNKEYYRKCCLFDKSKINGIVQDYHSGTGGIGLTINDVNYKLAPDLFANEYEFIDIVSIGDSIDKSNYSDTLVLFKASNNMIYIIDLNTCCKEE